MKNLKANPIHRKEIEDQLEFVQSQVDSGYTPMTPLVYEEMKILRSLINSMCEQAAA